MTIANSAGNGRYMYIRSVYSSVLLAFSFISSHFYESILGGLYMGCSYTS
jgi:hypothetical protein